MKKRIVTLLVSALITGSTLAGCAGMPVATQAPAPAAPAAEAQAETPEAAAEETAAEDAAQEEAAAEETAAADAAAAETAGDAAGETASAYPEFNFSKDKPHEQAIWEYFKENIGQYYEKTDISLPIFDLLRVDDSDPEDTKVWGDFWLMNYDLKGTTLLTRSGGNYPGLFHLAKTDDGFKVTEAKFVEDGERNGESVKEIFGVDDELLAAYNAASYDFNDCLLNSVMIYREANGTEIKAYEDYGWDPVTLDFDEELIIDYPDLQGSWTADGITAEIVNPKEGCVYYVVLTDSRDAEKTLTYEIYGQYEHSTDTIYYWNGWVKDEAGNDLDTNAEGELAVGEDGSLTWTNGSEEPVVLTK